MKRITKAIIPVAGLGTRFLPMTKASPKEMLPLVDKPLIQYVVEEAVAAGIQEIIMITGRGKRAIEDHFDRALELEDVLKARGNHTSLEALRRISSMADICYVRQAEARGLGDAILTAKHLIHDEDFAILLGDDVLIHTLPALVQMVQGYEHAQAAIIGTQRVERARVSEYGIVSPASPMMPNDNLYPIADLVEKPSYADAPSDMAIVGRYILNSEIFSDLAQLQPGKNNEIQLTDALRAYARRNPLYGLVLQGLRFDTGSKLGFLKANVEMGLQHPEFGTAFRAYLKNMVL